LIADAWQLSGSWTFQNNDDQNDVDDYTLQPHHILKAGVAYNAPRWTLGLHNSYYSSYTDNVLLNPDRLVLNPSASAHNELLLHLSVTLTPKLKLDLYIDNLLDEDVYLPAQLGTRFFAQNTLMTKSGPSYLLRFSLAL
jgi:outer membrane receptor protein involved in Fe transport